MKSQLKTPIEKTHKKIGQVIDAHGIKGWLYIGVYSGDLSMVDDLEQLVLVTKSLVQKEYSIMQIRSHKKGFICSLEELVNRNDAEALIGAQVWIDSEHFISEDGESLYLTEILNFEVVDHKVGLVGCVEAFSSNGLQDLLVINNQIEIPFVKEFVENVDFNKKIIYMQLPEGLLTINDPQEKSVSDEEEEAAESSLSSTVKRPRSE